MLKIANATYDKYFNDGINNDVYLHVLSKIPAAGAILGRVDAVRFLIPNLIRRSPKDEVLANRMDLSEGFYTTNIQRLGRAADALHLALLQSAPASPGEEPVIRLFPAWPDEWEGSFKLLARGGFLVSSSFKNGQIEFAEIASQAGADCLIHNPWPGQSVVLYRNGIKQSLGEKSLFRIKTRTGDRLVLEPK